MKIHVAFLVLVLAGCTNSGQQDLPPTVHGFSAKGKDDLTWTLSGPSGVRDYDGQIIQAYRFTQGPLTTWLDAGFRVVRNDLLCADGPQSCETYAETWWLQRGSINPTGLGIGWIAGTGQELSRLTEEGNLTIPYVAEQTPKGLTVKISSDGPTLLFEGNQLLPVGASSGYTRGVDLPSASWLTLASSHPTQSLVLFPGQERTQYNAPESHEQLLSEVLSRSPEARMALDQGGCVSEYELRPGVTFSSPGLLSGRGGQALFSIGQKIGRPTLYTLSWEIGELGIPLYSVSSGPAPETALDCNLAQNAPLGTDALQFETIAASAGLTNASSFIRTFQQFDDRVRSMYIGFFTPPHVDTSQQLVSFRSYSMQMHADDGTLTYVLGEPGRI